MSIWRWAGALAGGAAGFLVGGPAGAAAGASLGYGAGASADESNASSDAAAQNAANASNIQVNPAAWQEGPGHLGSQPGPSSEERWAQDMYNQANAEVERLKQQYGSVDPRSPEAAAIKAKIEQMMHIRAVYEQKLTVAKNERMRLEGTDEVVAVRKMQEAEKRQAPTVTPTNINFSQANEVLRNQQYQTRLSQLDQAGRLQKHESGKGQDELIERLKGDLEGKAPSLAQMQLEQGRDQAIANAASISNSARGNTQGISQIEALRYNQQSMQDAARQAGFLRAQEYSQARQELAGVLGTQRGQGIQEENIAATQLGQSRQQDIGVAGIESQNALSQAQLEQETKRMNLESYFRQLGMNDEMARFWADKYTHYKERPTDLGIDYQKTKAGISSDIYHTQAGLSQAELDRQQRRDAAFTQGLSTFGAGLVTSGVGGGVKSAPGTPQTQYPNAYNAGLSTKNPYDEEKP